MEYRRYKSRGLGKSKKGIEELPFYMFKTNIGKRGIGINYSKESSVLASNEEGSGLESRLKSKEEIANMLELVPKLPKRNNLRRRRHTNASHNFNIIIIIHIGMVYCDLSYPLLSKRISRSIHMFERDDEIQNMLMVI